jgi:cytidine deaminase
MKSLTPIESTLDPDVLRQMLAMARAACSHAHAPYSHFHVGASVLDGQGRIFSGCNVENSSFGLTMCAERNAIGAAVTAGAQRLLALVIYTPTESLTTPCGACRQVMADFGSDLEVHMYDDEGHHTAYALTQLLPIHFDYAPPPIDPPNGPPDPPEDEIPPRA